MSVEAFDGFVSSCNWLEALWCDPGYEGRRCGGSVSTRLSAVTSRDLTTSKTEGSGSLPQ